MKVREDCIFCRIISGEIPAERIFESDAVLIFKDIRPQAPQHLVVIPKEHVTSLSDLTCILKGESEIFQGIVAAAESAGIDSSGYRVVLNQGPDAGQEVAHIHFHILGGRKLSWPPG